jgi:hypothetical protein
MHGNPIISCDSYQMVNVLRLQEAQGLHFPNGMLSLLRSLLRHVKNGARLLRVSDSMLVILGLGKILFSSYGVETKYKALNTLTPVDSNG